MAENNITPTNTTPAPHQSAFSISFEHLQKMSSYLLGVSLIAYIFGFVITNLYLGSLGVVNLDVLKPRYILAGLLFVMFIGEMVFLFYNLFQTFKKHKKLSGFEIFIEVVIASAINIYVLYWAVLTLSTLSNAATNPPLGLPGMTGQLTVLDWLPRTPSAIVTIAFQYVCSIIVFVFLSLILNSILALLSKEKFSNTKKRRDEMLGRTVKQWTKVGNIWTTLVFGLIVTIVLSLLNSFIAFIGLDKFSSIPPTILAPLPESWQWFLGTPVVIYLLVVLLVFVIYANGALFPEDDSQDNIGNSSILIYLIAVAIGLLVPFYALNIYPLIPQQIGGGHLLPISITLINEDELSQVTEIYNFYLVDRTSSSTLILRTSADGLERLVIEFPNNQIQSIIYTSLPQG